MSSINNENDKFLENICLKWESINKMFLTINRANIEEIKKNTENLLSEMVENWILDTYLLEKITLTYLLSLIFANETNEAIEILNKSNDKYKMFNTWVSIMETNSSLSTKDILNFYQIYRILNASNLLMITREDKIKKVDYFMKKICDYYSENKMIQELFYSLWNWQYLVLKIINSEEINIKSEINIYLSKLPEELLIKVPKRITLPILDSWKLLPLAIKDTKSDDSKNSENLIKKLFSPNWRINRLEYFKYFIIIFIIELFTLSILNYLWYAKLDERIDKNHLIFFIPYFPVIIKRLHDSNYSWWWSLLRPIMFFLVIFPKWTDWENKYWPKNK